MLTISPQYLPLSKLLGTHLFRIPDYQRAYSWTSKERGDLFSDIRNVHKKGADAAHFMAAVVCLRRERETIGTDEFQTLEIVDGQQRLTTLIILLKAIALNIDSKDKVEKKAGDELAELLVKSGAHSGASALLLLQTNHDTTQYFSNYIRKGTVVDVEKAKTLADRELLKAIAECTEFVQSWKQDEGTVSTLLALLKNRLYFLLHEIENEQTVYSVFEVLNSRGLEVSWLDRLKSILMGLAFDLKASKKLDVIRELHTAWRDIYACIGLRQGMSSEALRFAATLKLDEAPARTLSEADAVNSLRDRANNAQRILDVADWLLSVTKVCDTVYANPRQHAVTQIAQARLLAVAIQLRNDLNDEDRAGLLRSWEKVTFRIYGMLSNDARKRVGDYVRLAWRVANEKLDSKTIKAEIEKIGADFPIVDAVENLRKADCYRGWEQELRYFFFRFEEFLANEQGLNFSNEQWQKIWLVSPSDSIEHIWAQKSAPESAVHRLGNLLLLPPKLNSKLQDLAPTDKLDAYVKTGLLIAGNVAETIQKKKKWNSNVINDREDALLKWALKEWAD